MKAPIVQQHMTRLPLEVEQIDNVATARRMMDLFGIRHVPVMSGFQLKGIVSQRDILDATIRLGDGIDDLPIDEIYQQDVLTVGPLATVDEVAGKMLQHRVGSAVVVDGGYVVGIFTSTDALKTLASLFAGSAS